MHALKRILTAHGYEYFQTKTRLFFLDRSCKNDVEYTDKIDITHWSSTQLLSFLGYVIEADGSITC